MKTLTNRSLELSIIGSMLYSRDTLLQGIALLQPNHFADATLRDIFTAAADMARAKQVVDSTTITAELSRKNAISDNTYMVLAETMTTATATDIRTHVAQLKDYAFARELAGFSRNVAAQIDNDGVSSVDSLRDSIVPAIREIVENALPKKSNLATLKQIMPQIWQQIEKSMNGEGISGLRAGITELDLATTGFHPGEFIIVAGRPGHGKSSLGVQIAEQIAIDTKLPPLFFSLEMPKEQLAQRMLAARSGISTHRIRGGLLGLNELNSLSVGASALVELPFLLDDTSGVSIDSIYYIAEKCVRDHGTPAIIIDYLQLVKGPKSESRTVELGHVSKTCKAMAKDLNIPVIGLAQLGRGNEKGLTVRRPVLSDLRESGDLEQDADCVIACFQEDMYLKPDDKKGIAELIILKQRNGPIKTIKTRWLGQFTRYENMEQDDYPALEHKEEQEQLRF